MRMATGHSVYSTCQMCNVQGLPQVTVTVGLYAHCAQQSKVLSDNMHDRAQSSSGNFSGKWVEKVLAHELLICQGDAESVGNEPGSKVSGVPQMRRCLWHWTRRGPQAALGWLSQRCRTFQSLWRFCGTPRS